MNNRIYYTKPSITELEVRYATDAALNGWGEKCYDYIIQFENAFKSHLGVKHAIATSSCTGAMHLGLAGLGIGFGDEVILADINWIASAAPITYLGATPVLVDIDPVSWCIDPSQVERAITPKTKAIVAVHLYGNLCNMDALLDIGHRHGIPVIEDAAEAIGSKWKGSCAGSMGAFGTFSFHGTKTMTTGEGGMFVTNDDNLFERVLTLSNHGRSRTQSKQFWPDEVGFKYKMSNIQAAIGLAQVQRLESLIQGKRRVFDTYAKLLAGAPLTMNPQPEGALNGYWMPTVVVDACRPFDREALLAIFKVNQIDGRVFFWPLSDTGHFERRHATPVSHDVHLRALNLPSYHDIGEDELVRVSSLILSFLN
jgi:perosamine synthetase